MDVVVIIPEPGNMGSVARALLSFAEHPGQVRYVSSPQAGFEVSIDIFAKFDAASGRQVVDEVKLEKLAEAGETPKKRGRPKKTTEPAVGTDDTSEEE